MTGTGKGVKARACVQALHAYAEEAGSGLNLQNNTNLFGPNPAIRRALDDARAEEWWDYPSLTSVSLREALAKHHGVPPECIVTGNGSNELIDVTIRTFADPGTRVAFHTPTFSMIPVFVAAHDAVPVPVPLGEGDFSLPAGQLAAADARVTFVCTPNNPTGNAFPREAVDRLLDEARGVVVVDEAYVEFAGESRAREVAERENLVVLRTFSKAYGLAGLRVGYAVAHPDLAREMGKVRGPFRLNAFSELAALHALEERDYLERVVDAVRTERGRLARGLEEKGFHVFPSDANFLLVAPPVDAKRLADALETRGIHVRDFSGDLAAFLRVTVGPAEVTDRFLAAVDAAMTEVKA